MANIAELTVEELEKKIKSAKIAVERNTGNIKSASEKKLAKLEAELSSRGAAVKEDIKEDVKAVEKAVDKANLIFKGKPAKKPAAKKSAAKKPAAKKPAAKKVTPSKKKLAAKKPATKKPAKREPRFVDSSPTEKFELTIDGKVYKFSDLKSKEQCEKANKAVAARYKEVKEHKAATKVGIERASTIPVTKRITDGFASIAKKAIAEVPVTKISGKPQDLKKEIAAVESAFDTLFDKLGDLMGKQIPQSQRKQIMDILTKFEDKVEKGTDKKSAATSKVRKEDGGMAGTGVDMFGAGNPYSYISLM